MNAKMTPGPWRVGDHPHNNSGTEWREVLFETPFGQAYLCEALEPNARAIAAVPDLIAALQDLINPRFDQAYRDGEYWAVQAQTAARAALAKAGVA